MTREGHGRRWSQRNGQLRSACPPSCVRRSFFRTLRLLLASVAIAGCIHRESVTVDVTPDEMQATAGMRNATNLPAAFTITAPAATAGDCPRELRDPGLQATLSLRRSVLRQIPDSAAAGYRAFGDYAVEPRGIYGDEVGEGVRVDCSRLHAIGVVRL